MSDNTVFQEVQAALLNSECDPYEAGRQGLCALYSFVGTELDGSPLAKALERVLTELHVPLPFEPGAERKDLRKRVLSHATSAKRKK